MKVSQRILRWLTPDAEKARMNMREARCRAMASMEDIDRIMSIDAEVLARLVKTKKINGTKK